ncbi:RNA polymerase factor sigma-54 [Treponema sp. HNW]|uniref:RNA polymerase factor sigma-54 n=1 Tax=Treponema sp. HNW TaxID=3116654 RepID=UPI003D0F7D1F
MRLDYSQQLQQTMRLSPRMIQAINLIAMPIEDLREHIYEEAEKNPAIEIVKESGRSVHSEIFRSSESRRKGTGSSAESDAWQAFMESAPAHSESLQEHLLSQLSLLHLTDDQQRIGERIIQNLNSRGYHNTPPESLLTVDDPLSLLNEMLHIVRRLDPQGTACTDLRESLFVQAELKIDAANENRSEEPSNGEKKENELALLILKSHFDILEKKRSTLMCKTLNERKVACSQEEFDKALAFIRTLDPFPARQFSEAGTSIQFAVPEIAVRRVNERESAERKSAFVIEFIGQGIPEIAVSPVYKELSEQGTDIASRQFADKAVREAHNFIQNIRLRNKAVYSAAEAIVRRQYDFFDKGPGNLRPLRMKDIAEEIGVHETTVSRIANGKYLQCEWGLFEIKHFFTNALERQGGQDAESAQKTPRPAPSSQEAVKHRLREIIEESEKKGGKKLSDSKLAELLGKEGISIARRTVAKYRNELNIESSFDRL